MAFTANVMVEDHVACREAGMNAFIGKPVRPSDLEGCLAEFALAMPGVVSNSGMSLERSEIGDAKRVDLL